MTVTEIEAQLNRAQSLFMSSDFDSKLEVFKNLSLIDVKEIDQRLATKVVTVRTILKEEINEAVARPGIDLPLFGLAIVLSLLVREDF